MGFYIGAPRNYVAISCFSMINRSGSIRIILVCLLTILLKVVTVSRIGSILSYLKGQSLMQLE